jgi:hypothetical protein
MINTRNLGFSTQHPLPCLSCYTAKHPLFKSFPLLFSFLDVHSSFFLSFCENERFADQWVISLHSRVLRVGGWETWEPCSSRVGYKLCLSFSVVIITVWEIFPLEYPLRSFCLSHPVIHSLTAFFPLHFLLHRLSSSLILSSSDPYPSLLFVIPFPRIKVICSTLLRTLTLLCCHIYSFRRCFTLS